MEEKATKQRGGYREGAGRKPKGGVGTRAVSLRVNKEHYELIVRHHNSFAEFVDRAIRERLKREGLL